ncbi:MAG TPA: hypothetical protein VM262_10935 [Acidimicrobiales bacterium]|nr:hypothetical protein [Acidimicrobiales bacterium]
MPSARRRPILGPAIVVAALLVVGGTLSVLNAGGGDGLEPRDDTEGTYQRPPIEPPGVEPGPAVPPPMDAADELASYRVVYRVEGFGPSGSVVDTEVREVRRPFDARAESRAGPPPGQELTSVSVWSFGVTEIGGVEQERATLLGEPVLPNGEVGVTADLEEALDAGVLVYRREREQIAGHRCHRFRTGGPVDVVQLTRPTSANFADLCIDDAGLVLGESWVVAGELFRRRTAVEVDLDIDLDDRRFEPVGVAPRFGSGGGLIGQVTTDSQFPGVDHWALPTPPAGFELRGRFSWTPPAGGESAGLTGDHSPIVTGLSDVYESGPAAVIVVNGGTSDGSDALGDLGGDTFDVGELGTGHLRRRVRGAEILVRLDGGRFVKVHGTLSVEDLVAVARNLVVLDGASRTITALEGGENLPRPVPGDEGTPHRHGDAPHTHEGGEIPHAHD